MNETAATQTATRTPYGARFFRRRPAAYTAELYDAEGIMQAYCSHSHRTAEAALACGDKLARRYLAELGRGDDATPTQEPEAAAQWPTEADARHCHAEGAHKPSARHNRAACPVPSDDTDAEPAATIAGRCPETLDGAHEPHTADGSAYAYCRQCEADRVAQPEHALVPAGVVTHADGFGTWHADVKEGAAAPLLAARRAIRAELYARSDGTTATLATLSRYVRQAVRELPADQQDRPGFIRYAEANSDDATRETPRQTDRDEGQTPAYRGAPLHSWARTD